MRELGRVFANEWMKLMHRRRLWITIVLGVIVVCGLAFISYMSYQSQLEYNSLQASEKRLDDMQQRLETLQEKPESNESERPEGINRDEEMSMLENNIESLKQRIKRNRTIETGDWKKVLNEQKTQIENNIQTSPDQGNENAVARSKGELMELNYYLSNDIRPQSDWERSAYDEMNSLLGFTTLVFLPMLVIILVADIVSGETTSGTIKLLLVRPVSRGKILFGKWLVSMAATVLLALVFSFVMWGANIVLFGTDGANEPQMVGVDYTFEMADSPGPGAQSFMQAIPGYENASILPIWQFILYGIFLIAFSMMAVATITFLCSTLFKSAMVSTGVAFAFIIIGQILVQMVSSGEWLFWLFSVHLNLLSNWTGDLSRQFGMNMPLWLGVLILVVWSVISLIAALLYFKRKDVLNA